MKHEVESSLTSLEATTATFCFGRDLSIFDGHFPSHALVPGVYLIEAARVTAERLLDRPLRLAAVDNARFTAEVLPDVEVRCTVRLTENDGTWICEATLAATAAATAAAAATSAARVRLTLTSD